MYNNSDSDSERINQIIQRSRESTPSDPQVLQNRRTRQRRMQRQYYQPPNTTRRSPTYAQPNIYPSVESEQAESDQVESEQVESESDDDARILAYRDRIEADIEERRLRDEASQERIRLNRERFRERQRIDQASREQDPSYQNAMRMLRDRPNYASSVMVSSPDLPQSTIKYSAIEPMTGFDIVAQNDVNVKTFLDNDSENIAFVLQNQVLLSSKTYIRQIIDSIKYSCLPNPVSVDTTIKYISLRPIGIGSFIVQRDQLNTILTNSSIRIIEIYKHPIKMLTGITSYQTSCPRDTSTGVYELRKITINTGGKPRKGTHNKHHKKNKTNKKKRVITTKK